MISFLAAPSLNNTASCGRLSTLKKERRRSHKEAVRDPQEMVHPIIGTRQHFLNGNVGFGVEFFVASLIPCVSVPGEALCWICIRFSTLCGSYLIPSQHVTEGNRFIRPTEMLGRGGLLFKFITGGCVGSRLAAQGHR